MFLGVVKGYCEKYKIDISKEANIGKGPVDFKFVKDIEQKVLIELKLAKSTTFWSNLKNQLPAYLKAEEIKIGYFLIICYSQKDLEKVSKIEKCILSAKGKSKIKINTYVIDALNDKVSASKIN